MKPVIQKMDLPEDRRILAISDIHGHDLYLRELLKRVDFSEQDILFLLGDLVDKGPNSLKTLRGVMDLCNHYTVYPLMGNADARVLHWHDRTAYSDARLHEYITFMEKRFGGCLFTDMCKEIGIPAVPAKDIGSAIEEVERQFAPELEFIRGLPAAYETQNIVFVHAGLPSTEFCGLADYDLEDFTKCDAFLKKGLYFEKYVVVGHWPVMLYAETAPQANPIIAPDQKIICIDGGCGIKEDGQLNVLVIPNANSDEFQYTYYDSFPKCIAQTDQAEAVGDIFIKWVDSGIDLLKSGPHFSKVRHRSTGKLFTIPNDYLYRDGTELRCGDYTDYQMEVHAGETVSVVRSSPKGYFIKKDGRSGWYSGSLTLIKS